MAQTTRIFQTFSAKTDKQKRAERRQKSKSQTTNNMKSQNKEVPALYPTSAGVQANESDTPETNCSNDNAMYPIEVQQAQQTNESTDKANAFKENLPEYKKICDKVYEAADVENNAAEVEPMLPPVIS